MTTQMNQFFAVNRLVRSEKYGTDQEKLLDIENVADV